MTVFDGAAIKLLAGLALFIFGLRLMREKLERALGRSLRFTAALMEKNRAAAWLGGLIASGVLQSSASVSAAAAGLCSAGCITLGSAAGAMLGAGIGGALTALWLPLGSWLAVAAAAAGGAVCMLFRRERMRQLGGALICAAVLLVGLDMISASLTVLGTWEGMNYLLLGMRYPALAVVLGAGVSALLQSAMAVVGLVQVLAMLQLLPMEAALYVMLGANIGAGLSVCMACAGTGLTGKRAACVQMLAKALAAAACIAALHYWPLGNCTYLAAMDAKWQIALLHIAFNAATAVVFLPLSGLMCLLSRCFVRGGQEARLPVFYDERILQVPAYALRQLEKETQRMCDISRAQLQYAADCWQGDVLTEAPEEMSRDAARRITEGLLVFVSRTGNAVDHARAAALLHAAQQAGRLEIPARQLIALRAECMSELNEEAADDLLLLVHKSLNMIDMAQHALFGGKMSEEMASSMRLMLDEARECAHEARLKMLENACDEVYLEALREAAHAAMCAGEMLK